MICSFFFSLSLEENFSNKLIEETHRLINQRQRERREYHPVLFSEERMRVLLSSLRDQLHQLMFLITLRKLILVSLIDYKQFSFFYN